MLSSLYYRLKALWGKDVMDAYLSQEAEAVASPRRRNLRILFLQIALVLVSGGVGYCLHWAIGG